MALLNTRRGSGGKHFKWNGPIIIVMVFLFLSHFLKCTYPHKINCTQISVYISQHSLHESKQGPSLEWNNTTWDGLRKRKRTGGNLPPAPWHSPIQAGFKCSRCTDSTSANEHEIIHRINIWLAHVSSKTLMKRKRVFSIIKCRPGAFQSWMLSVRRMWFWKEILSKHRR